MKVLLDTHVLLWYVMGTPGLTARARGLIDAKWVRLKKDGHPSISSFA
jgi:PIN domain nuclease of toxin-antitoxin system